MTSVNRHFLGWEKPFLQTAAKWLQEHYLHGNLGTAKDLVVVVSGRSVGRRLQSILVEKAFEEGRAIDLPEIVTSSSLLHRLHGATCAIASNTLLTITTATIMRDLPEAMVEPIVGTHRLAIRDLAHWCSLSKEVNEIAGELTSGGNSTDPSTWPQSAQSLLTLKSRLRFETIHKIRTLVMKQLDQDGFVIQDQQWLTLSRKVEDAPKQIVLFGTSDLHVVVRMTILRLADLGASVAALVYAPQEKFAMFDAIGCVIPDAWTDETIDIPDVAIEVAGSPSNQANRLLQCIARLDGTYAKDEITIAITDTQSIPLIRRQLEGHGVPTRFAGGSSILRSPEVRLLQAVGEFIKTRSFSSYASLVRHPSLSKPLGVTSKMLHELDRYYECHLPSHVGEHWFVPTGLSKYVNVRPLITLHGNVLRFLGATFERKEHAISKCCDLVRAMLLELFGDEELDVRSTRLAALVGMFGALDTLVSLPQNAKKGVGGVTTAQVIELVLEELEEQHIPEYPDEDAIEIVGWLETMHEESPCLFIVGMDSNLVSASAIGHPSIPDHLRKELDLITVERNLARDAHAVMSLQYSRADAGNICWIVARKSKDGDPLTANPLLLRCDDDEQLAHRANKLIVQIGAESPHVPCAILGNTPPTPTVEVQFPNQKLILKDPLTRLSVTAFKDYIACPYRFWLRHVLKLDDERDDQSELDYAFFGSFVHAVLERFGKDKMIRHSTDVDAVSRFLEHAVDDEVKSLFGKYPMPTIKAQAVMAKHRLRTFASAQVEHIAEGWTIVDTERKIEWNAGTESEPCIVVGTIDRVDKHTDGSVLVLDYKTGSKSAKEMHGPKDEWRDLQLPIYRHLAASVGYSMNDIQTGYVIIGSKQSNVRFDLPAWDEVQLQCADDLIYHIIEQVKECNFGSEPTIPAPPFFEDLSWICRDGGIISTTESDDHGSI